jgi:simple sugar transport system permease protein
MTASDFLARLRGRHNEGVVALTIILLALIVGAMNPGFLGLATVFNVLRNSYEPLLFALGVMLVLLMGGIDVSFDAVGIFAAYTCCPAIFG